MNTSSSKPQAFAVWITGLPASGKSTLATAVARQLRAMGVDPAVLESDVLRPVFTPGAQYQLADREAFYRQLARLGASLTQQGIPVIFDATGNLRRYRDSARQLIPQFVEAYIASSLETCMSRDPKGLYRKAQEDPNANVPGVQAPYEPPESPEVTVSGEDDSDDAAAQVVSALESRGFLTHLRHTAPVAQPPPDLPVPQLQEETHDNDSR